MNLRKGLKLFQGCFNGVLSGFQGCLLEVEWCLRQVSKVFQGRLRGVFESLKGGSRELQDI